jgi:hypothetical protein
MRSPDAGATIRTCLPIPASAVFGLPRRRVGRRVPALRVARGNDIRVLHSSPPRYATVGEAPPARSGCFAKVASTHHFCLAFGV